jgi:hypothetical protein
LRNTQTYLALLLTLAFTGTADAHTRRLRPIPQAELPPVEGRGCYFERGVEYCGSYCYVEINGKRYCQQRLRDAHSQAPIELWIDEPDARLK